MVCDGNLSKEIKSNMAATFTDTGNSTLSGLRLVVGSKRLHFHEGQQATSIVVVSSDKCIAVKHKSLFDSHKGIHTIDLLATAPGTAVVTGTTKNGQSSTLTITVVGKLALPARNSTEGLVARLLLAEVMSPSTSGYDATDAETCMKRMIVVLKNRLKNPGQFGASDASTIDDIIKAPGQFKGFEKFPDHFSPLIQRIQDIVNSANDNNRRDQLAFQNHLNLAIGIAQSNSALTKDPSSTELIGWRTSGHGSPGSNFVAFGTPLLNTQFFERRK